MRYHNYADDTQIYVTCESDVQKSMDKLAQCVSALKDWMSLNMLKLNTNKTDLVVFCARQQESPSDVTLRLEDCEVKVSDNVKNLGVYFDRHMSMEVQVNKTCHNAYINLKTIGKVRNSLSYSACQTVIHSLVMSRIDANNCLLNGVPKKTVSKLQRAQNAAARMLTHTKRTDHITPVLKSIHWLPIEQRIKYKTLLTVYKCLTNCAPTYLKELLTIYVPARSLRSGNHKLLRTHNTRTKFGERCFAFQGPAQWNSLPIDIRNCETLEQFKKRLKTYLFHSYFANKF
jgi:hypothetical protein